MKILHVCNACSTRDFKWRNNSIQPFSILSEGFVKLCRHLDQRRWSASSGSSGCPLLNFRDWCLCSSDDSEDDDDDEWRKTPMGKRIKNARQSLAVSLFCGYFKMTLNFKHRLPATRGRGLEEQSRRRKTLRRMKIATASLPRRGLQLNQVWFLPLSNC